MIALLRSATLAAVLVSTAAVAAPVRPVAAAQVTVADAITVTGHGEYKVQPDIVYATVSVVTDDKDASTAASENATKAQAVLDALRAAGIAVKDIQTSSYNLQPQYDYRTSPAVLTGYQVTNSMRVTIRDISKAGQILDKATNAGANGANSLSFDLADRPKAMGMALADAVHNAKSKADTMADASGVKAGRVESITEGTAPTVQPIMMRAEAMVAGSAAATTPISTGEIDITADVTVTYALSGG